MRAMKPGTAQRLPDFGSAAFQHARDSDPHVMSHEGVTLVIEQIANSAAGDRATGNRHSGGGFLARRQIRPK